MAKSNKGGSRALRQYRIHALLNLMNQGLGSYELECFCVDNFNVSSKVAASLVEEAYSFSTFCMDVTDLKRIGAVMLRRFEYLYRESLRRRDLQNARGCVADIARYYYAPVRDFLLANPPPTPLQTPEEQQREHDEGDF